MISLTDQARELARGALTTEDLMRYGASSHQSGHNFDLQREFQAKIERTLIQFGAEVASRCCQSQGFGRLALLRELREATQDQEK